MRTRALSAILFFLLTANTYGQQTYVGRYDAYAGYMYLASPNINLAERGFHTQAGIRLRNWLSAGFDYSVATGHTSITPNLLPSALQQQLGATFAQLAALGRLPPGYSLTVPIDSNTQNFAAGPQFSYRRWSKVTLYIRPSFGAVRESAVPRPTDPITTLVVSQLAPSGRKLDWTGFYGVGGGFDLNFTKNFSLRIQGDIVHDHLFNDLLKDGRNTFRVSVGPAVQFGRNMAK